MAEQPLERITIKGAKLVDLAKYVKAKGWINGDPTIYGSKGRKGIFENLISLGLAKKEGDIYTLTDKGEKWVNPESILETEHVLCAAEDAGSVVAMHHLHCA